MPFGALKVEKPEVGFLLAKGVGVDAEGQLGVRVAELGGTQRIDLPAASASDA